MPALEVGVSLPTIGSLDALGRGGIADAARHVEQLGLDSVSVADLVIGDGTPALESTVVLATAAAVTERIGIGFGVLVLPLRQVAWLGAQIATLQHLSGDRVVLGVGSGGFPGTPFWQAVGAEARERGRLTDAALDVLPSLIAGEPTRLEHQPGQPTVTLAPAARVPPILIGGTSDVALRRVVRYGDGWAPSLMTPAALASRVVTLRELAAEQGRAAPVVDFGTHALLSGDSSARADLIRSLVVDHGMSREDAESIPITGDAAQVAEQLSAFAAAGADSMTLALDGEGWLRQCEVLAEARALVNDS
jgi:alkanesulfonate monooxygenase SsuD/methylene tetrahydromethanopterin reductase-like flavin-dependent oxidoreductase (luciferase family)